MSHDYQCDDWEKHSKLEDESLKALGVRVYSHPFADSAAYYYVESLRPLTLVHLPYCDAWQLPAAHIRGLTASEVKAVIEFNTGIRELFEGKRLNPLDNLADVLYTVVHRLKKKQRKANENGSRTKASS